MSQTWTENDEGSGGTTIKQGMINLEDKGDSLRSNFSGTAFPTDADRVVGQFCYRTDGGAPTGIGLYILTVKDPTPANDTWVRVPDIVTAFVLTLLDDADAATFRTTLGLGTAAVLSTGTSAGNVPTVTNANSLYLRISQLFAEIASLGSSAQATARGNLGLGALATLSTIGAAQLSVNSVGTSALQPGSVTQTELAADAKNNWTTVAKTTTYTVAASEFVKATVGSSWTLTLPASPSAGQRVGIYVDSVTGSAELTIDGGSNSIGQQGTSMKLYLPGDTLTLIYDGAKWMPLAAEIKPHICRVTKTGITRTSSYLAWATQDVDTSSIDQGVLADLVNDKIVIRRTGLYAVTGFFAASQSGPAYMMIRILNNASPITHNVTLENVSDAYNSANDDIVGPFHREVFSLTAGDEIQIQQWGYVATGTGRVMLSVEELIAGI